MKPNRFFKYNVSASFSIAMHSATPPGMMTHVFPSLSILTIPRRDIGSSPNHVHKCRTNGTLKIAELANARDRRVASLKPLLFIPSSSYMKYHANEIMLKGNTPCGSNPIKHPRPLFAALKYPSSSSNSNAHGKYLLAASVTAFANAFPHPGGVDARLGITDSVTNPINAHAAPAFGNPAHAIAMTPAFRCINPNQMNNNRCVTNPPRVSRPSRCFAGKSDDEDFDGDRPIVRYLRRRYASSTSEEANEIH
jgi:hypothetical protein